MASSSLFLSSRYSDFTLNIVGSDRREIIPVHKSILFQNSYFFEPIFDFHEKQGKDIAIIDISEFATVDEFLAILSLFYADIGTDRNLDNLNIYLLNYLQLKGIEYQKVYKNDTILPEGMHFRLEYSQVRSEIILISQDNDSLIIYIFFLNGKIVIHEHLRKNNQANVIWKSIIEALKERDFHIRGEWFDTNISISIKDNDENTINMLLEEIINASIDKDKVEKYLEREMEAAKYY